MSDNDASEQDDGAGGVDGEPASADWYVDPEYSDQYRFWDGSAWTEHRSPRYLDDEGHALEPTARLVADTFSTILQRWPGYAAVILIVFAGGVLSASLLELGYRNHPAGDFTTQMNRTMQSLWDRAIAPETGDTDSDTGESDADGAETGEPEDTGGEDAEKWQRLEVHWTLAAALLITVAVESLALAATMRLTLDSRMRPAGRSGEWLNAAAEPPEASRRESLAEDADPPDGGRTNRTAEALLRGAGRIPRLLALHLLVLSGLVGAGAVLTVFHLVLMLFMLSIIILLALMAIAGLPIAYVIASAGPPRPSLEYTIHLVNGRFGPVMRRMLTLLALSAVLLVLGAGISSGLADTLAGLNWSGQPWEVLFSQSVVAIPMSASAQVTLYVGAALLYRDLGGELDEGLESPESPELAEDCGG